MLSKLFLVRQRLLLLVPFSLAAYVFAKYPCNHGCGPWLWLLLAMFIAVFTIIDRMINGTNILRGAIIVSICVVMVVVCDRCNMLVQYDVWLCRGQPEFGSMHKAVWSEDGECPSPECFDRIIWRYDCWRQGGRPYSDDSLEGVISAAENVRTQHGYQIVNSCREFCEEFDRLQRREVGVLSVYRIMGILGHKQVCRRSFLQYDIPIDDTVLCTICIYVDENFNVVRCESNVRF